MVRRMNNLRMLHELIMILKGFRKYSLAKGERNNGHMSNPIK